MTFFDFTISFFWAAPLLVHAIGTILTARHFNSVPIPADTPYRLFPVSILKPLKGVDEGLEKNLRTFFELDYPEFEIILSVADRNDPARRLAEKLIAEYPRVRATLRLGEVVVGLNPKINNLVGGYDRAAYDWILISDSNVRVEPRYLKRLVDQITTDTGMITSVVLGTSAENMGGRIEAMYLNTFYAKAMVLAATVDRDCVVGKSMLFRKSSAERFGGLRALGNYLAEDYVAGEAMKQLGLKVSTAWHPVPQHIGKTSLRNFWDRHIRWGRIRKAQSPVAFICEALSSSTLSAIMGLMIIPDALNLNATLFLGAHFASWFLLDVIVLLAVGSKVGFLTPIDWVIREFLTLPIWFQVCTGNTVEWRGIRYQLGLGGILTPVLDSP